MLTSSLSELPPYLTVDSGLNSGYMIAQYTAAALVAESKILCHPASVDSIPTSGDQEDHVSMGMTAALKLMTVVRNTQTILGIEALCAAQAIDLLTPLQPGVGTRRGYDIVRGVTPRLDRDRVLAPEIAQMAQAVAAGELAAVMRSLESSERAPGAVATTERAPGAVATTERAPGTVASAEQAADEGGRP